MIAALELRHVSRFYRLRGEVVAATVSRPPTHRKKMVPMISSSVAGRPSI